MHSHKFTSGVLLPSVSVATYTISTICSIVLGLTGCAPRYPVTLPHLTHVDESYGTCPKIEGRYNDTGDIISQEGTIIGKISLTKLLHGGDDPLYDSLNTVVITGPLKDMVEVISLHNETELFHWQQSRLYQKDKDEFSCAKGFVVLGLSHHTGGFAVGGMGAGIAAGRAGNRGLWCRRAVDGSLIVLDWSVDIGWIVIMPYWIKNTLWYRFQPAGVAGI